MAYVQNNPEHTAAYTAEKTTVRLILSLKAACRLYYDQFDIKSAFVHEDYGYRNIVLIKRIQKFDGTMRPTGKKAGIRMKNVN